MGNRFIQIADEWFNVDRITSIKDDAYTKVVFFWFGDTDEESPFVLRGVHREVFLKYMDRISHVAVTREESPQRKAIPGGVLVDIFRAIYGDKYALQEAAKVMVPVTPEFQGAVEQVLLYLSVPEVREHLVKELDGVDYVSDNK